MERGRGSDARVCLIVLVGVVLTFPLAPPPPQAFAREVE